MATTADFRFGAREAGRSGMAIEVDVDNALSGTLTALERQNLAFAAMQACNATALGVRDAWKQQAVRVFDRPTPLTINAVLYAKATKDRLYADVYLRNEAHAGNPPAAYLRPEVEGGARPAKGFERLLRRAGQMPGDLFAVPAAGVQLDAFGNVPTGTLGQVLSQLQARRDPQQNQTAESRARRVKRERKRIGERDYFALTKRHGALRPGVYQRLKTTFGSAVRGIFRFVRQPQYKPRYDIFGYAQRTWDKLMPFYFRRELDKALLTSKHREQA